MSQQPYVHDWREQISRWTNPPEKESSMAWIWAAALAGGAALAFLIVKLRGDGGSSATAEPCLPGMVRARDGSCVPYTPPLCDPAPYVWNEAQVRAAIEAEISGGQSDLDLISVSVSEQLFGDHPTLGAVVFPPISDDPGVQCVWLMVRSLAETMLGIEEPGPGPGSPPGPPTGGGGLAPGPGGTFPPLVFTPHGATDDLGQYPWMDPRIPNPAPNHPSGYPVPGMLYQFAFNEPINTLDEFVRNTLGSALVMAGRPELVAGMQPANQAYNADWAKRLRGQYRALTISRGSWNDLMYGQTNLEKAGGQAYALNQCDRGLNFTPVHANNLIRLSNGFKPWRTTTLQGNRKMGTPTQEASSQMLVFAPAIDLNALKQTLATIQVIPATYANGQTAINPPPVIQDRGIDGEIPNMPC